MPVDKTNLKKKLKKHMRHFDGEDKIILEEWTGAFGEKNVIHIGLDYFIKLMNTHGRDDMAVRCGYQKYFDKWKEEGLITDADLV